MKRNWRIKLPSSCSTSTPQEVTNATPDHREEQGQRTAVRRPLVQQDQTHRCHNQPNAKRHVEAKARGKEVLKNVLSEDIDFQASRGGSQRTNNMTHQPAKGVYRWGV